MLFFAIIVLLPIFFFVPIDPDLGWHLKLGQFIALERMVPWRNLFSYTMQNYRWADSYWFTQVLMHLLYKRSGLLGLNLVSASIAVLTVYLGLKAEEAPLLRKCVVGILFSILLTYFFLGTRPLVVSSLLFMVLWNVLKAFIYKKDVKSLPFFPFIFLVWANVHADFILGLLLIAGVLFVEGFISICKGEFSKRHYFLLLSFLGSFLATFINPYGPFLWRTLLYESNSTQFSVISEWLPLKSDIYVLALYVFILATTFSLLLVKRAEIPLSEFLAVFLVGLVSIRFSYVIRVFLLLSLGLWARFFTVSTFLGKDFKLRIAFPQGLFWVYGMIVLPMMSILFVNNLLIVSNEELVFRRGNYPVDAIHFIKANPIRGNIFNEYGWGGFLIWQVPYIKTFIDGRMPSWRIDNYSVLKDYISIRELHENFWELIREYKIDFFLIPTNSKLARALEKSSLWRKVYEDKVAVIFKRRQPW